MSRTLFAQTYTAEARLSIDNAEKTLAANALADLKSLKSLDNAVRALNLSASDEFSATRMGVTSLISDIFRGRETTVSEAEAATRERLSGAVGTHIEPSGELVISVTARDAGEGAAIANHFARNFGRGLGLSSSEAGSPVHNLRETLERAESSLSGFIAETGAERLSALDAAERTRARLAEEQKALAGRLSSIREKLGKARAMTLNDVLSKPLPDSLEFTGLEYARERYVQARINVDQLSSSLGPRHPRLLAANGSLSSARSQIESALSRLVASLQTEEGAAAASLSGMDVKIAALPDDGGAPLLARLQGLEIAVTEARENYAQALALAGGQADMALLSAKVTKAASAEDAKVSGLSLVGISALFAAMGLAVGAMSVIGTQRRGKQKRQAEPKPTRKIDVVPALAEEVIHLPEVKPQHIETVGIPYYADPELASLDLIAQETEVEDEMPGAGFSLSQFLRSEHASAEERAMLADRLEAILRHAIASGQVGSTREDVPPLMERVLEGKVSEPVWDGPEAEDADQPEWVRYYRDKSSAA